MQSLDVAPNINTLRAAQVCAEQTYIILAERLSKARVKAAKTLSTAMTTWMQDLSMAGGRFEVVLGLLSKGNQHGLERVEFRVANHAGTLLKLLAKVASGGELARISLALSVIDSTLSPTSILIFDEVDSGIGGAVAEVVGRLLHQLGQIRQVLCVTHLPQIATRGEHHFSVSKFTDAEGTPHTEVTALDYAIRVEEISRMLGGIEITDTTRKHAKEMLAS